MSRDIVVTELLESEATKELITRAIAGHLDLYEPVAESITDEILDLLRRRISCLSTELDA